MINSRREQKVFVKKIEKQSTRYQVKYRKLKALMKKSLELSIKCGLNINILVFDPTKNEIQERYTDDSFCLEEVNKMV